MTASALAMLYQIETKHPGLKQYLHEIALFIGLPDAVMRERFAQAVQEAGKTEVVAACREWEAEGILPYFTEIHDKVGVIWDSLLFHLILDSIGFYPPPTTDIAAEMPAACQPSSELLKRSLPSRIQDPYWKYVLYMILPEFYLEPYLKSQHQATVRGCDLACGWGRASLTLRQYQNRHIDCLDLSKKNLELLYSLAERARLTDHITTHLCDITHLPFNNEQFDFFLSFDLFEHLTDEALTRCTQEILRCGRLGAVLYTETPMHSYCPAVTHIQDFSSEGFVDFFQNCTVDGKTFRLVCHHPFLPNHFTFLISPAESAYEN